MPGRQGNIGIAGHRDGFFRALKDVVAGDTIELESLGRTDSYRIDQAVIVDPNDTSVLRPRATPSLTLVTCYPFYFVGSAPKRYILRASIVSSATGRSVAQDNAPRPATAGLPRDLSPKSQNAIKEINQ
jgi:sortase A